MSYFYLCYKHEINMLSLQTRGRQETKLIEAKSKVEENWREEFQIVEMAHTVITWRLEEKNRENTPDTTKGYHFLDIILERVREHEWGDGQGGGRGTDRS